MSPILVIDLSKTPHLRAGKEQTWSQLPFKKPLIVNNQMGTKSHKPIMILLVYHLRCTGGLYKKK